MHKTNLSWKVVLFVSMTLVAATHVRAQAAKQTTTVTGQLVCSDCWSEADRKTTPFGTPADVSCARDCAERGIPSAIAVKQGDDYKLYLIEQAQLKKNREEWLHQVGQQVEVSGQIYAKQGKDYLTVESFKFVGANGSKQPPSTPGSEVELSLKDLSGLDQRLSSYRGRIVVLNFWATWCVPCRKEMPDLAAIQNAYALFGVQVIGAAADQLGDREKVLQFVKQAKINFPVWLGATTENMRLFGVGPGLPATVIIGADGKIAALHYSVIKQTDLRKELDQLLHGNSIALEKEMAAAKKSTPNVSLVPS
jgi:thiol-disulfide isomerase/thioredoxin